MGFGTTDTILGKQQKTFFLESELNSIKDSSKVLDVTVAPFLAGSIVTVDTNLGGVRQATNADIAGGAGGNSSTGAIASPYNSIFGVAFENHTSTLDECAGSGLATILWDPHVGRTLCFDTTKTYIPGQKLYIGGTGATSTTTNGVFTNDNTLNTNANPHVAYVVEQQGPWLKYRWIGGGVGA